MGKKGAEGIGVGYRDSRGGGPAQEACPSVLCRYIKGHPGTWEESLAAAPYSISIKKGEGEYVGLAIFNYGTGADFSIPEVQEARGIILDVSDERAPRPVCWPFRKFGNYGEPYADSIDWATARVQEKVDGSIMKAWHYKGEWRVSTNSCIDARTADVGGGPLSFRDVFDLACANMGQGSPEDGFGGALEEGLTYIFELVSPQTRVIVPYGEPGLYHIGTRDCATGRELDADIGIRKPREHALSSLDEAIAAARMMNADAPLDGLAGEGFVVVDGNWNRVKVKSPDYLKAHYFMGMANASDEKILDIVRSGEADEIAAYFPGLADRIRNMEAAYMGLIDSICRYIEGFLGSPLPERKDFAIAHKGDRYFRFAVKYLYWAGEGARPDPRAFVGGMLGRAGAGGICRPYLEGGGGPGAQPPCRAGRG